MATVDEILDTSRCPWCGREYGSPIDETTADLIAHENLCFYVNNLREAHDVAL